MGQRLFNAFPFSVCKQLAQPRRLEITSKRTIPYENYLLHKLRLAFHVWPRTSRETIDQTNF